MPTFDWDEIQQSAGGDYKPFIADGNYTVVCDGIEIKEVGDKGSVVMKFHFAEDNECQYPTADHWLSFKNDNWRRWHNKCLMEVLGASDASAKKAVEMAESKEGKDNIIKGYDACYKKLLAKKPQVEIEVFTENKYARAEFLDRRVAMPHGDEGQPQPAAEGVIDPPRVPIEETEEVDLDSIPF